MSQADLTYRILAIIFPVFCLVVVGYLYSRRFKPDMTASNRINIDVFVPMLIFDIMSSGNFALMEYRNLALAGFLVIIGSGLVAWPACRLLGYQWRTFLPPMMFSNSGNMGLPLILLAFGKQALPAAVMLFVVENFLHFSVGQQMIKQRLSILLLIKNPMILATMAGIAISESTLVIPDAVQLPIHMLGQISIPLMLFSLGVRLTELDLRDWHIGLSGALICPLSGL
ncbi:MAG: AEC family transporter, partial [Gammaproteobacteria bacterium]|nr:AEC family transporter [Gammaproteobacteria bacterium]